jgi:hypothetical protein
MRAIWKKITVPDAIGSQYSGKGMQMHALTQSLE